MTNDNILLFSMDTFDRLMDRVDEYFGMSDVQMLPQIYREQIEEDPYSRWFAYDVTRNHLRYYRRYKVYDIEFMNNRRGPRWAFYPAVMSIIDELVDDGSISDVSFDQYRSDPVWIDGESIGIVGKFDTQVDFLDSMGDGDEKLEYLDLRVDESSNIKDQYVRIVLTDQLYPRLRHSHTMFNHGMRGVMMVSGPVIKYFSIDNSMFMDNYIYDSMFLHLMVNSNVRLDYFQLYWCGLNEIFLRYMDAGNDPLTRLANRDMKYIDISTRNSRLKGLVNRVFDRLSSQYMVQHGPSEWPRLTHLGFNRLMYSDNPNYTITGIEGYVKFLHRLTSLDVPLMNAHIPIVNSLSDQLIYVGLRYLRRANNFTMPTKLKYVRVLDLSLPPDVDDMANIKIGRWNLPETCRVLSLYSPRVVNELNMNFDLTKFGEIKILMVRYHRNFDESWIRPVISNASIVERPYDRSAILTPTRYEVTWRADDEFYRLSVDQVIDLLKQMVLRNNAMVFLKRDILRRYRRCIRRS